MKARLGLAIGERHLVASGLPNRAESWCRELTVRASDSADYWSEVRSALDELRQVADPRPHACAVTLAPPLVQARCLVFPALRVEEIRQIVQRDVPRYFAGICTDHVIAVMPLTKGRRQARVLIAAAPTWLITGFRRIAGELGLEVASIEPGHAAWARAVSRKDGGAIVFLDPAATEIITARRGQLQSVRRAPSTSGRITTVLQELGCDVSILFAQPEAEAAAALGVKPTGDLLAALQTAAENVAGDSLALRTAEERAAHRARRRRLAASLWFATAALLVVATGLHRINLQRQLRDLERARTGHRAMVEESVHLRDRALETNALLDALASAARAAPRWTLVLHEVASALPRDAFLTQFRASGDSILMEGAGRRAVAVFEGLQRAKPFALVRPGGPIRQEVRDSGPPIEHFVVTAVVRGRSPGKDRP